MNDAGKLLGKKTLVEPLLDRALLKPTLRSDH